MIFSPIGEELFFRGIVHSSFAKSIGNFKASIIDSVAFALTHISHFGTIPTTRPLTAIVALRRVTARGVGMKDVEMIGGL